MDSVASLSTPGDSYANQLENNEKSVKLSVFLQGDHQLVGEPGEREDPIHNQTSVRPYKICIDHIK